MAIACHTCKTENPDGSAFCIRCGIKLQQDGTDQLDRGMKTRMQTPDFQDPQQILDSLFSIEDLPPLSITRRLARQTQIDTSQESSQQQQIFQWALLRSKIASSVYIGAVALGIIIILFGAVTVLSGNILVGSAEAMSGIVIDAVTLLARSLSAESEKGLIEAHNNAIESERINIAIELTKTVEGVTRNRSTEAIIMRLINPTPNTQESLTLPSEQQPNTQRKSKRIREQPIQNPQTLVTQDNNDE